MNIVFKYLHLYNFLSFSDCEIDLNRNGCVLVSGINENPNDNATSNGSGKSSIWDAISWVLTGETIRGCKEIVNIYADDGAYVSLDFNVDSNSYKIIRSKDHSVYKTTLKIFINGEDKSGKGIRDSEKLLLEYLPDLTSDLIGSVIILGQGLPKRFSNNSPSARKEILEKLSKSDFMIDDIKLKLSDRKDYLASALQSVSDKLIQLNTEKNLLEKQNEDLLKKLKNIPNIEQLKINQENLKQQKLELSQQNFKLQEELIQLNSEAAQLSKKIEENNQKSAQIKDIYDKEYRQTIIPFLEEISKLKGEKSFLQSELKRLNNIRDICPTCGQKLAGIHKPDTTHIQQEIAIKEKIISEKLEYKEAQENLLNEKSKSSLEFLENIAYLEKDKAKLLQAIDNTKQNIDKLTISARDVERTIDQINLQIQSYQNNIDTLSHNINDNSKRINELSSEILYNNNEKNTINNSINIINKINTIAIRDFRGFLLTNIIEYINKKAAEYAIEVFNNDKISFSLTGNNINIYYNEKIYENLSGGEKQKIDLIVQFAIRDMLCTYMNFSSSIIVLDEIFDNLDYSSCQNVLNLIFNKLTDINTIYIITHHSDIFIPVDEEITIIKNEKGISRIK